MTQAPQVDVAFFRKYGYALIPGVFSPEEMHGLRQQLEAMRQREVAAKNYVLERSCPNLVLFLGDVLSKAELRELDYVLFDHRILACARQLLGDRLVYFGDSSVQCGEGFRGFHKDNVDRSDGRAPDWQSEYTLIRFGIYAQDHSRHSGGLKVRLRSHNYPWKHRGRAVNIPSRLGDVVVWSLRTTHSGNYVRLKWLPGLCLHTRLERLVPLLWRVPEEAERFAVFGTLAAPGAHLDRYLNYVGKREDYRPHFLRAGYAPALLDFLAAKNVELVKPIPEFGSLFAGHDTVEGGERLSQPAHA